MTAYAIVTLTINDTQSLAEYRAVAADALAKHKAEAFHVSSEPMVIEGSDPAPDVVVILTFPDREHALAWINDPEIANVHTLRRASGASRILLM